MSFRKMILRFVVAGVLVALSFGTCLGLDQVEIDWIAEHAIPLAGTAFVNHHDDLLPLRVSLAAARLVGVGEGTHGTREFFTLRLRLMEFLASELGFTEFMFEFPYAEGCLIDQYVQTGAGNPAEVLARVYCTPWNHQEMLETIEWMRTYNRQDGLRRIGFYGIDIHDGDARLLIDPILAQVERASPSMVETFESKLNVFRYPSMYHAVAFIDQDRSARDGLRWAETELLTKRGSYSLGLSSAAYDDLLYGMHILIQRAEYFATYAENPARGSDLRDESMADNVFDVLEAAGGNAKGMFSGHNYHISRFEDHPMPSGPGTFNLTSAGSYLSAAFGTSYVVLATTTRAGEVAVFQFPGAAVGNQYEILPVPRIAYAGHVSLFRASGIPEFILDLRLAGEDEEGTHWIREDNPWLHFGTTYFPDMRGSYTIYTPLVPAFDLVAYVETTSAPTMRDWIPKDEL